MRFGCRPGQYARRRSQDGGAGLVEMIVSVALIGTVMTALAIFFTTTVAVSGDQGSWQTAGRLAQTALDRVNALRGSAPTTGRDRPSSDTQWSSPVVGAASWLADLREAWDPAATFPSGQTAPLPTTTQVAPVDGVSYGQTWYVGRCWQPAAGGGCGPIEVA
ncbi:MAG: hypothetical protein JXA67_15815, partial [Micromonosporaceae bacterium]|nr:hypothetical protein [Micromonosporaceae bacterium]